MSWYVHRLSGYVVARTVGVVGEDRIHSVTKLVMFACLKGSEKL